MSECVCVSLLLFLYIITDYDSDSSMTEITTHLERMADLLFQEEEDKNSASMVINNKVIMWVN